MSFRLTDVVDRPAASGGDRPALTHDGRTLTYAELADRSARVAAGLASRGLGAGSRVAWIGKNRTELFDLLLGAPRIRAVTVPLNNRLTEAELLGIVDDARAALVVLGPDFAHLRPVLGVWTRVMVVGEDYDELLDPSTPPLPHGGAHPQARDDDTVLQLYTSGTTGQAKGVLVSHRQFGALLDAGAHWAIDHRSVALVALPLFHIGGTGFAVICLAFGARVVLVADIVPAQLLDVIEHEGVTNTFLVPAVLQSLVAVPGAAGRDWSALRAIAYGASPITSSALRRVLDTFGAPLFQVYGSTETTGAITQLEPADHDPDGPRAHLMRSAGRPYPWVEVRIADPETGKDLGSDQVGEVWIRSAQVTDGYWERPDDTAAALTDDGWFRSGDGGYVDGEGYLFLTDRIKDMIVTGAENVYPAEVENVIAAHPDVAEVAVIGVPDPRWGETVKAVVAPVPGATIDPDELLAWTRERIAGFKRPRSVDLVDALPRNPSGKVLKKDLRAPYWSDAEDGRQIG